MQIDVLARTLGVYTSTALLVMCMRQSSPHRQGYKEDLKQPQVSSTVADLQSLQASSSEFSSYDTNTNNNLTKAYCGYFMLLGSKHELSKPYRSMQLQ